jgi:hypothetical protein
MKEGTIYRSFIAKDGRKVTLRASKWSDIDDGLYLINSLVEEKAMILICEKQTQDSEIGWISRLLTGVERDLIAAVVAEVGHLLRYCEISKKAAIPLTSVSSKLVYFLVIEMWV